MVSEINEDVAAGSLLSLNDGNDEESKQDYIGENIYFEYVVPITKKTYFVIT